MDARRTHARRAHAAVAPRTLAHRCLRVERASRRCQHPFVEQLGSVVEGALYLGLDGGKVGAVGVDPEEHRSVVGVPLVTRAVPIEERHVDIREGALRHGDKDGERWRDHRFCQGEHGTGDGEVSPIDDLAEVIVDATDRRKCGHALGCFFSDADGCEHLQVEAWMCRIQISTAHLFVDVVHQREARPKVRGSTAQGAEQGGEGRYELVHARQDEDDVLSRRGRPVDARHERMREVPMGPGSVEYFVEEASVLDCACARKIARSERTLEMLHHSPLAVVWLTCRRGRRGSALGPPRGRFGPSPPSIGTPCLWQLFARAPTMIENGYSIVRGVTT